MATKAETLNILLKKKSTFGVEIPKFIYFTKKNLLQNQAEVFFKIKKFLKINQL